MANPTMRHHPRIGCTYIPDLRRRVAQPGGGYLLRTNAAGFRSDNAFEPQRRSGVRRALMFGDSQTAGDGVSNGKRFGDLLERKLDALEVYNFAITGTGTDQQYVTYREFGAPLSHDLLIICVFVENVQRVQRKMYARPNPDGRIRYYGKPYFQVEGGELMLRGVPVPEQPWTEETLPESLRGVAAPDPRLAKTSRLQRRARRLFSDRALRIIVPLLRRFIRNPALPAYDRPDDPKWLLMRQILETWIAESPVPVLVVPLPLSGSIMAVGDAARCRARFAELAKATGCALYDPLPDLWRMTPASRQHVWDHKTAHLSEFGHSTLADLIAPHVEAMLGMQHQPQIVRASREELISG